jgi:outer membrane protein TolC
MQRTLTKRYIVRLGGLVLCLAVMGCAASDRYQLETIRSQFAPLPQAPDNGAVPPPPAVFDPSAEPLTLARAVALAKANNPDLGMATARIARAQADLAKASAPFYPYLSVYTEYLQGDAPSAYLFKQIDQRKLPPDADFNDPGWFENWESGMRARWNLYNAGRDRLGRETALSGESLAQWTRRGVENRLIALVIQAFYDARAAREFIQTAQASVATVESQLRVMTVRFKAGGALKSDILTLEVRLAQAREDLVGSRNRYRIARAALTNLMGIDPAPALKLADTPLGPETLSFPGSETVPDHAMPETLTEGLAYALTHRPELTQVAERLRQTRMALDSARGGYLPRVDLEARYYLDDPGLAYDTERDNWAAAVILNWDLFSGFRTRADIGAARAAIDEALAADRKTLLEIQFDVQQAYLNLQAAQERLKVALSAVDKAEESLGLVKTQYEGGSATVTRYLEAELDRNQARIRVIAARYDQEKTRAEIGRAIGRWYAAPQPQQDRQ